MPTVPQITGHFQTYCLVLSFKHSQGGVHRGCYPSYEIRKLRFRVVIQLFKCQASGFHVSQCLPLFLTGYSVCFSSLLVLTQQLCRIKGQTLFLGELKQWVLFCYLQCSIRCYRDLKQSRYNIRTLFSKFGIHLLQPSFLSQFWQRERLQTSYEHSMTVASNFFLMGCSCFPQCAILIVKLGPYACQQASQH